MKESGTRVRLTASASAWAWTGAVAAAVFALSAALPAGAAEDAAPPDLALVSSLDARAELLAAPGGTVVDSGPKPGAAFLYSLAVPGAGQLAQGEKRGYLYMAAELAFWVGFFTLNGKGLDEREDYESYADAHWDFEGYQAWYDENCTECQEEMAYDYECRPLAAYGTQEYYEDIGKYDTYWRWWSDSGAGGDNPEFLDVRNEYWDMRGESNLHLRQARYAVTAAFLNHLVSAVDSFLSARRSGVEGAASGDGAPLLAARPTLRFDPASGGDGLACALVFRY
jgi:hypothetical protein